MELTALFTTSFLVGLSGAMMPGPLLTLTIAESARRGFVAGPMIVLGHGILEGILVLALILGLAALLTIQGVAAVIALAGGMFLVFMGWGMIRDVRAGRVALDLGEGRKDTGPERPAPGRGLHPVLAGMLVSLANPYWSLWWATVGLGYITLSMGLGGIGLATFFSGHILSDLAWYGLVAAAVAGGRRFLSVSVYRGILFICGAFLLSLGLFFIYTGFHSFLTIS